jgi:hypothetical protein
MTTPTFTTPPAVIPARGSSTFSTDASAWVTWQSGFEGELSTAMPWVAARVADVAADVVLTADDVVSTNADVVSTGDDVTATAADRVQTGADVTTTLGYLDAFEGSYIGQYANDAAADASGKTIVDGVFYFKTTATAGLRIYNGSWSAAVLDTAGALMAVNNLSDVGSAATARNNLGLGSVDNTSDANKPVSTAQQTAIDSSVIWTLKSTTYTASSGEKIAADVTAGAWTLTLPASPNSGDVVMVSVIDGDAAANNLTIDGNGNNIYGDTTLIYDVPLSTVWLVYNSTEWRLA